ncbi:MAG TPA: hypothetical protein VGL59_10950, partial [Polyangia bacterium]
MGARPDGRRSARLCAAALAASLLIGGACGGGAGAKSGPDGGGVGGNSDAGGSDADDFSACVWQGTKSTLAPGAALTANNTADMTGAALGQTAINTAVQRKKIEVRAEGIIPDLMVGDGYLWRPTATSESAYLSIAITNIGTSMLCSIKGISYRWLDAAGNALAMPDPNDRIYVDGSVGMLSDGDFTDSCLGPGEQGYFTDVKTTDDTSLLFSQVATVAFSLSGPFSAGTAPAGKLVPQSYDVGTCPTMNAVRVTLTNTGTDKVALQPYSLSPAILMDDS